ncbi:MAG: hypothetical protein ACRELB_03245 [Polyangiaceae bacterium]
MRPLMLVTLVLLCACGASKMPEPPAKTAPAAIDFDAMSKDQKMALMKGTVAPRMKAAFQAFDPHDFADFTCETCHGAGARTGDYKMPNPALPRLDLDHGFASDRSAHPRETEFMQQRVLPEMARMLGQPERSPEHPDGLGCMDCHTAG